MWKELTHTRPVNVELLGSSRLVVEIESTILDVESSRLLLRTSAAGVLGRKTSEEAALGGVEARVLHATAGMDSDNAESLVSRLSLVLSGSREGRDGGGSRGSEEEVLEVHSDGGVFSRERKRKRGKIWLKKL